MSSKSRSAVRLEAAAPVEGAGADRHDDALAGTELEGLRRDTRGVVFVEYVALLLLVTIIGVGAVLALGVPLVNLFRYQQLILSLPIP
jgi:hypothetical protein